MNPCAAAKQSLARGLALGFTVAALSPATSLGADPSELPDVLDRTIWGYSVTQLDRVTQVFGSTCTEALRPSCTNVSVGSADNASSRAGSFLGGNDMVLSRPDIGRERSCAPRHSQAQQYCVDARRGRARRDELPLPHCAQPFGHRADIECQ